MSTRERLATAIREAATEERHERLARLEGYVLPHRVFGPRPRDGSELFLQAESRQESAREVLLAALERWEKEDRG